MINLKMLDYNLPMTTSRNVIGEIAGRLRPDEYVAVSGHIDSWDVGQGAMDDAGGVMVSAVALAGLKYLELRPNRTLQVILWTAEEPGLWGVEDFARQHTTTLANYSAVFESDGGTFRPLGLDFAGTEEAGCIVQHVLKLVDRINATQYQRFPLVSSDITVLQAKGVPGISLANQDDMYFWYHHTEADTLSMQDPTEMDLDAALFAVSSYVLADLSVKLPRQ
jgi:carboxypeptidase Q